MAESEQKKNEREAVNFSQLNDEIARLYKSVAQLSRDTEKRVQSNAKPTGIFAPLGLQTSSS